MAIFILFLLSIIFPGRKGTFLLSKAKREEKVATVIHSADQNIYVGSEVVTPCFPEERTASVSKYIWLHHSGEPIVDIDRYKVNSDGDLTIQQVNPEDSGVFICKAISEGGRIVQVEHKMKVIQLPTVGLHVYFSYNLDQCIPDFEASATSHMSSLLKEKICEKSECKLGIIHSNCHHEDLSTPVLRIIVPLLVPEVPSNKCNKDCTKKKIVKVREKLIKTASEIIMEGQPLKLLGHKPLKPSDFEGSSIEICDAGFEFVTDYCVPCHPGHYLKKGECTKCPKNQYVGKYAATECRFCETGEIAGRGAKSSEECAVTNTVYLIVGLLVLLFLIAVLFGCCYWIIRKAAGKSKVGVFMDKVCNALCFCNRWRFKKRASKEEAPKKRSSVPEISDTDSDQTTSTVNEAAIELNSTSSISSTPSPTPPPPPPPPPPPSSYSSKIENPNANPTANTVQNMRTSIPQFVAKGGGDFLNSKMSRNKFFSKDVPYRHWNRQNRRKGSGDESTPLISV